MSLAEKQAKTKELAVSVAERIYHYKWVAASVGIGEKTMIEWRKADPDFDSRLDQARAVFISNNMRKARPEFLLESADRATFGQKAQLEMSSGDSPIQVLLKAYGIDPIKISEGESDDRKDDGALPEAPTGDA